MKNLLALLSIIALNSAIRVPNNWREQYSTTYKDLRPRREGGVPHQYVYANPQRFPSVHPEVISSGSRWTSVIPKRSSSKVKKYAKAKPNYYKKPTPMYKKKNSYEKPEKHVLQNIKKTVPYITYKKPDHFPSSSLFIPQRPLKTFSNIYPQIHKRPKTPKSSDYLDLNSQPPIIPNLSPSGYLHFDNSFNNPIKVSPESNSVLSREQLNYKPYESDTPIKTKPDSNYVPKFEQSNFASNDHNTYTPNQNIVNYFQSVKTDILPNYAFPGDKTVTYAKGNYPDYNKHEKNQMENYSPKQNDIRYFSHLDNNYKDEKIFEPEENDMHYVKEEDPKFETDQVKKSPASTHEVPQEIPTRPIYPGTGLWAQPGLTHRPYISQQTYDNLKEDEVKPDGYDTFIKGQKLFNLTGDGLTQRFRSFPEQHQIGSFIKQHSIDSSKSTNTESFKEPISENESESEETEEDEFVPTRLYAQVRASEDMEYLPIEEADDGKLREAIKESKIHTVYTEEGYEDSAYDHAGHEKEAENDEGFEDLQRAKLEKKEKKVPEAKYNLHLPNLHRTKLSYGGDLLSDKEIEKIKQEQLGIDDTDVAGTQFEDLPIENIEEGTENQSTTTELSTKPKRNNHFISTKETKTMTTKEKVDGNTETEISSKVKIISQPNNSTKSHKYVKIYPKIYKTIRRQKPQAEIDVTDYDESNANAELGQNYTEHEKKLGTVTNFTGIYIEEVPTTTEISFTKYPSTEYQDIPEEIPITTLPTTAIPKPIKSNHNLQSNIAEEALKDITKEFLKIHKRTKRYTNDFSNLKIERNDFVPNISHEFGKINDYIKVKYPYYDNYKEKGLNIDSPLRYSQNMKQMPIKTGKKMIFYEDAEKRLPCPEINTSLNPIPEKALNEAENKNIDENEDNHYDDDDDDDEERTKLNVNEEKKANSSRRKREVNEESKSPRLAGLGDKIDCLRARYFGDNPLDSPFFDEVTVGTIEPIFKELKRNSYQEETQEDDNNNEINYENDTKNNYQDNFKEEKLNRNILKDIKYQLANQNKIKKKPTAQTTNASSKRNKDANEKIMKDNLYKDISHNLKTSNKVHSRTKSSTEPTVLTISLLTTPEYTIDLKPKHIYDQIKLLEHLPNHEEIINNNKSSTNEVQKERSFSARQYKALDEDNIAYESSDDNAMLPEAEELKRRRKIRRKRPQFQIFDINRFLPTTPSPVSYFQPITPYSVLPISNVKNAIPQATKLQIFDINKFIPTTPPTKREIITSSTVLPKYKVLSEVFYKDDIKPNEQLHVFTDILNNIKNASQNQQIQQLDTSIESSEPVLVTLNSQTEYANLKKHLPVYFQDSYLQAYGDQEIDQNYLAPSSILTTTTTTTTTTSTMKPTTYRRTRYKVKKSPESMAVPEKNINNNFEQQLKLYIALQEAKKKQQQNPIFINNEYEHIIPVNEDTYDYLDKTTKVMGLMPPGINHYKTIYHPKRDNSHQLSSPNQINRRVNKFFVMGMKPPPHQKILVYSDFLNKNQLIKKPTLSRGKRSTRGAYSPLSRDRGQQETESEKTAISDADDDYIPHRPKNYYYDENTGKIVYLTTKKPQLEDVVEEEIEYEEVTEPPASTSKPKQDPIFATATPPPEGKGYIDFVLKLKQNKNYIFIPDPTTTEKGLELDTEKLTTSTLKPVSTTPPEFINILSKVRKSNQYKLIEDKKEKKPSTEAVQELVDDEEEPEDEDIHSGIIQNAPGGQSYDASEYFGIFDVTDFIPKIKNYLPKTSYDTSKYKTIERPTSKTTTVETDINKFEEQNERNTAQKYTITEEPTSENSFVIITEGILNNDTVTKQTEEVPVTQKRRRPTTTTSNINTTKNPTTKATFLRRRKPTTLKSIRTANRESTPRPPPTSTVSVSHEEKIRRVFRKRPTTRRAPTIAYLNEEQDDTTKVLRRRSDTTQKISTEPPTTQKSNTFVERFKTFHRNKKHGGGYKRDNSPSDQIRQPKQVINVPVIKDVEVIGEYDKAKRHGGNYRKVDEGKEIDEGEDQQQDYDDNVEQNTGSDENSLRISLLPNHEDKEEINEYAQEIEHDEQMEEKFLQQKKRTSLVGNKKKSDKNSKGKFVTEATLLRLTDVVPKPEAFYNDPTLPRSINMLADKLSSVEIKDLLSSTDSSEIQVNRDENEENVYVLDPITKRPIIIKDPSKRLYFYAPV